jgi:AraC-like DNA-binding protein
MFRDDPREKLAFFRSPALPGVEVMDAIDSGEPWHVYHEQYAFCACHHAATTIRYRGAMERIDDRSVSFFEPGESHHNGKVHKRSDFKVLFIQPEVFERAAEEAGSRSRPHFDLLPRNAPGNMIDTVYAFCDAVQAGEATLDQETRLVQCLGRFMSCAQNPAPAPRRPERPGVMRAKRYLVERFNESVTLAELAGVAGLSKFHLVRQFAAQTGLSPHAFQVHVRVERARILLRRGFSAVEAAMLVGFADQSHFTRHFKRIWGITPGVYAAVH